MKKSFITLGTLISFFFVVSVAIAAQPPADVPVDHWAYAAVNLLIKDGLIDGYPDGTFRGDKPISRYEMAQLVDKALQNEDKATKEQKALIEKLAIEYALELNKFDTRVTTLEKNQSPLKIDGMFQFRYEYTKNPRLLSDGAMGFATPSSAGEATHRRETVSLLSLNITNKFDGNTEFHGVVAGESLGGRTTNTTLVLREANVTSRIGSSNVVGFGRFLPDLGYGTIGGAPYMDGGMLAFGTGVKVRLYCLRFGDYDGVTYYPMTSNTNYPERTYNMGDAKFNLSSALEMSLAFNYDRSSGTWTNGAGLITVPVNMYKQSAVGLKWKVSPEVVIDGEYAQNKSDFAKEANSGSKATAYFARVKYKGANPVKVGSCGFSIEYKKADDGFDPLGLADPFAWNAPLNYTSPAEGGIASNIKGLEYGFEATLLPRTIFKMAYDSLKWVKKSALVTNCNQSFFTAQVAYIF